MKSDQAAENLQVIRTLMERSAVYRRALAPVMIYVGGLGSLGGIVGWGVNFKSERGFIIAWTLIAIGALVGSFLLIRRQALKAAEPFWTPPTSRVVEAITPPYFFAAIITMIFFGSYNDLSEHLLPPIWMGLYGCGLHAAGFSMPRGIKRLGWLFIACGSLLLMLVFGADILIFGSDPRSGHAIMGTSFGGLHLAYGFYLYFTEPRRNEP
jgi:hypothetical protein